MKASLSKTTDHDERTRVAESKDLSDEILARAILQLNGNIFGLVFGIICGLIIFLATNWLLIKGGERVGPHLQLLSQFFIGYSVSFIGSLIGMAYGFVSGYIAGWIIAWVYNRIITLKTH